VNRSNRRVKWFAPVAALTLLAAFAGGCSHLGPVGRIGSIFFKKPELRFQNVGISNVSFSGFTLGFQVEARNPNRFPLTLRNWQYEAALNKMVLLSGHVDEEVKIQGHGVKTLTIPVEVGYRNFSRILKGALDRHILAYDFRTDFDCATWLGSGSAPFRATGELDMPKEIYIGRGLLEQLLGGHKEGEGVIDERDLKRWKKDFEDRMKDRSR
jgi:LEA14-like dessication related protein